jgi:hypothetical protein
MAKTPKYPDEKLLEAVVKYADQHRGKIEATKLAEWASANIEGLEGVADRHFTRPEEKTDPKTGKKIKNAKLCTVKINELNAARNTVSAMNTNVLLRSANVDKFLGLPSQEQRRYILDTRAQVDKLVAENNCLRAENKAATAKAKALTVQMDALDNAVRGIKEQQNKVLALLARTMKVFDENERKKMLASIGVCDGKLDLDMYVDSLTQRINETSSINEVIRNDKIQNSDVNTLMEGIDF